MRKAISMVLAAMLLFALPASCFAAAPAKPDISIAVNNIKDETMEVAIQVGAGNFKSVGAVLEYDASKLQPMRWSTNAAITVTKDPATAAAGWAGSTVIESVCPDELSGKPALAYQTGTTGYLYLGAEAAAARSFTASTQVVTVRFTYLAAKTDARFSEAAATVKFAQNKEAAYASPVKGSMIYQTEDRTSGEYKFYYLNPLTDTGSGIVADPSIPDGDKISTPSVTPDPSGETANKGEADTEDFVTIAFYDWDSTLLGTRIVAKGTSLIDPNTAVNRADYVNGDGTAKYTDAQLAEKGVAPLAPEGNVLAGGLDSSGNAVTAVNKAGYTYAGWVDYTADSTPRVAITDRNHNTITGTKALTNLTESAVLKAGYNEGTTIGTAGNSSRYYTVHTSPFKLNSAGTFLETTLTVVRTEKARRINEAKTLVLILRPAGAGDTLIRVNLGDADIQTYTLSMPTRASETYSELDALTYGLWDEGGITRGAEITLPASVIVESK